MSGGGPTISAGVGQPLYARSAYNELAEVNRDANFASRIRIVDATLRDGEQAADIALSLTQKVALASKLAAVGVPFIQVGIAGNRGTGEVISALVSEGIDSRLTVLVEGLGSTWREGIRAAADAGAHVIKVSTRTAPRQLAAMGLTLPQALGQVAGVLAWARSHVAEVWLGLSYMPLSRETDLPAFCQLARDAGVTHVGISDSVGVAKPEAVGYIVSRLRDLLPGLSIGVHCHDDFGLAVACTIAGLAAGADTADVTVNGYGERSGNCALEELVVALEVLYGVDTGIELSGLMSLSSLASELTGVALASPKPVVGQHAFAQKLDSHVRLTCEDPSLLEPYPPELVGNERAVRLGVGSGPEGVRRRLAALGLTGLGDEAVATIVSRVNDEAVIRSPITDERLGEIVREQIREPT